jgi:hypothetical protein
LVDLKLPVLAFAATDGSSTDLSALEGRTVVYVILELAVQEKTRGSPSLE